MPAGFFIAAYPPGDLGLASSEDPGYIELRIVYEGNDRSKDNGAAPRPSSDPVKLYVVENIQP
jgi:hypothetical protein